MASIEQLQLKYENLDNSFNIAQEDAVDFNLLMAFDYEYPSSRAIVSIDTDEFTAVCPWTSLPDFGTITISYVPDTLCIELKSLKYYLLTYSKVGIVQEHAANKILTHLVELCNPISMNIKLDYKVRGGLHTTVEVNFNK